MLNFCSYLWSGIVIAGMSSSDPLSEGTWPGLKMLRNAKAI